MAEITIKDFKGLNLKAGLWDQGFAAYSGGMDFYGLGDDPSFISYKGVLQRSLSVSAMPQAAATNNITNLISEMTWNPSTSQCFGIDASTNARIYKWVPATPNWILDHTATGIGSSIIFYGGTMYYTAGTQFGKLASGVYTDAFQTGLTAQYPKPMKVFAGSLFVGHGQYVAKYDGTTWTLQKLTLPSEFVIRSMEVFRDGLYISADTDGASSNARIFVWDGTSPTYNDAILLEHENRAPSLKTSEGILWMVGNHGGALGSSFISSLTPIWIIQPGSQPNVLFELPLRRNTSFGLDSPATGIAAYKGGILIGSSQPVIGAYENGEGGIWYIGKDESTGLFHASLLLETGGGNDIGGIFSSGSTQQGTINPAIYAAFKQSGPTYGVFQASSVLTSSNNVSNGGWISLPIDAGSTKRKSWTAIKLNFEPLSTGTTIKILYRLDSTNGGFTLLKTFTSTDPSTDKFMFIPINKSSRTIAINIQISTSSTSANVRLYSFTLYYEPQEI